MKGIITTIIFILAAGILSNVIAQAPIDDGIRARSTELERVKRTSDSESKANSSNIDIDKVKKYFEGIQKLQDSIVKAYTTGKNIDYEKINKSSGKMTEMAVKLKESIFSSAESNQDSNKTKNPDDKKEVKKLIVDLDNAIGQFVTNPIFRAQKLTGPKPLEKAQSDLEEVINLSDMLRSESKRQQAL